MRSALGVAAIVVLLGACGPKKGPDGGGGAGGGGGASGGAGGSDVGGDGTGAGGGDDGSGADRDGAPLTRAECEKMIDHVLQIGMEEQRRSKPAEYVPTEAQVADIRATMVQQQMEPCLGWPRRVWECTMAAPTVDALYGCAELGE